MAAHRPLHTNGQADGWVLLDSLFIVVFGNDFGIGVVDVVAGDGVGGGNGCVALAGMSGAWPQHWSHCCVICGQR